MDAAYTIAVLDGTMSCPQRIELEVRIARDLERLLGGPEQVALACYASRAAHKLQADAQRWNAAVKEVSATMRREGACPDLRFEVSVDYADRDSAASRPAWAGT